MWALNQPALPLVLITRGICCNETDNTGKKRLLQKDLEQEEFNIDFQFMVAGTPQQNSQVKQKFATLYGKVRSALNLARITQGIH